jgi:tetratricopeptide (TPR) repeat protein
MLRDSRAWLAASVAAYFAAVFSKEHAVTLPGVAAALAFLCCRPSWAKLKGLAWVFGCYAAIALFVSLKQKGLLGAAYEPFAGALVQQIAQSQGEMASAAASAPAPGPPSTGALYFLSVENQALLFFRYLGTWLLPYPGWMSIDVHTRFPESASAPAYVAGLAAWLAYAVAAVLLLTRGGSGWALAGFALLSAWVLALAEVSTVRVQEAFVLYRSYLWMPLLGAALPALVRRVPVRWLAWGAGGVLLALLPCTVDRLRSFSSDYGLWDDAVHKVSDPRAPMAWRSYRNRGVALYNAGRYDAALGDFDRAIALDPSNAQAWLTRAVLFVHIGAAERALADLDRALALDPRSFEALGQRCIALGLLRRFPDALAACRMARDLNPADPMAHVKLGVVEALLGDLGSAEQDYLRALRIDPKQKDAHYQYAVLLQASSRGEEASAHFTIACRAGVETACESLQRLGARPLQ